jgi:hypothetical protein
MCHVKSTFLTFPGTKRLTFLVAVWRLSERQWRKAYTEKVSGCSKRLGRKSKAMLFVAQSRMLVFNLASQITELIRIITMQNAGNQILRAKLTLRLTPLSGCRSTRLSHSGQYPY